MPKKNIILSTQFWQDDKWAHKNYQNLSRKYPNKWVAILSKKVISFSESLAKVKKEAGRVAKGKDFPILFIEKGAHVYKN